VDGRRFIARRFNAEMEIAADARTENRAETSDDASPEIRDENAN
jgi:hypothetical protein